MTEAFYGEGLRKGQLDAGLQIRRSGARLSSIFWKSVVPVPDFLFILQSFLKESQNRRPIHAEQNYLLKCRVKTYKNGLVSSFAHALLRNFTM